MKQDELTLEIIESLIKDKKNLDFTGRQYTETNGFNGKPQLNYESESPLTFAIVNDNQTLFERLINAGADINYGLERWDWTPLFYSLQSKNDFYIKKLLSQPSLDINIKIDGENAFFRTLLSSQLKVTQLENLELLLNSAKKDPQFLNNKFDLSSIHEKFALEFLIKKMPKKWLHKKLNQSLKVAPKVLDNFISKKSIIKKVVNLLETNKLFEGKSVFGEFVKDRVNDFSGYKKERFEAVALLMLEKGHDINLPENTQALAILKEKEFYINYTIEKNYIKLNENISNKEITPKKIKI